MYTLQRKEVLKTTFGSIADGLTEERLGDNRVTG
jgi:hypothetical protein